MKAKEILEKIDSNIEVSVKFLGEFIVGLFVVVLIFGAIFVFMIMAGNNIITASFLSMPLFILGTYLALKVDKLKMKSKKLGSVSLHEAKMVLDWAESKMKIAAGAQVAKPDEYNASVNLYKKTKNNYDELVKQWINQNCNENI